MITLLENPFQDVGFLVMADFILLEEVDKPFKHEESGLYVFTYYVSRHAPEPLDREDDCIYVVDFMDKSRKNPEIPKFDKRFWALCRLQGMEEDTGMVRMAFLINAWSYDMDEVLGKRAEDILKHLKKAASQVLPIELVTREEEPEKEEEEKTPKRKRKSKSGRKKRRPSEQPKRKRNAKSSAKRSLPKMQFQHYEEDEQDDDEDESHKHDKDDSYLNSNPDDPEVPDTPDDDIPFEEAQDEDMQEDFDDSWADELEGSDDE